jgi:hypothetical protein
LFMKFLLTFFVFIFLTILGPNIQIRRAYYL